jgi:pimeloyl-ACP methyl ester carboxylesterase
MHMLIDAWLLVATHPAEARAGFPAAPVPVAVIADPPKNSAFPARNQQLLIPSNGFGMNALFFLAAGESPKPTMLLLHGLPGNERNLDLAQAVRRAGWNVHTFTYRGAWGSQGKFSILHALQDTGAAMEFLRSPGTAAKYGVDTKRIVIAGHSMGGYAAAAQGAKDANVAGVVLLDAWDIGATATQVRAAGDAGRKTFSDEFDDLGHSLGEIGAVDLADEVIRRGETWQILRLAGALAKKPVLTIYASKGIRAENAKLAQALRQSGANRLKEVEVESDHSFTDSRIRLASEVVRWLDDLAVR